MTAYIEQLATNGYCVIPQVFSAEEVSQALNLLLNWEKKVPLAPNVPFLNRDQFAIYNLQNKEHFFLKLLFKSADIEDALKHFLNDPWYKPIAADEPNYILRGYTGRSSNVSLPLHIDSMIPYLSTQLISLQLSIILEDQDEQNGCTLVVPGSHLSGEYVSQEALGQAIPVPSQAGDAVIWDSRLWHGALANHSERTRWAMIATFARWWVKQSFNITGNLPTHIFNELTDSQKAVMGFCSIPFNNESEGIDMKVGYEALHQQSVSAFKR